ncbi:hypothetical protein BJ508DRAFT_314228 [Ascobolus immersus RN42]|uniref:Uncharacterized protein n=1 Tax=Ascobolus immersus RN42 TaxID=1160509 RepID=A0A3N4HLK8_ASCIM|nr:hypothetical protein BJ508DRAFT_314228 [Ascobolus immersus RN42]
MPSFGYRDGKIAGGKLLNPVLSFPDRTGQSEGEIHHVVCEMEVRNGNSSQRGIVGMRGVDICTIEVVKYGRERVTLSQALNHGESIGKTALYFDRGFAVGVNSLENLRVGGLSRNVPTPTVLLSWRQATLIACTTVFSKSLLGVHIYHIELQQIHKTMPSTVQLLDRVRLIYRRAHLVTVQFPSSISGGGIML